MVDCLQLYWTTQIYSTHIIEMLGALLKKYKNFDTFMFLCES